MNYAKKELIIKLSKDVEEYYNFHRLIMTANKRYYSKGKDCRKYNEKLKQLRTEVAFMMMGVSDEI